MGKKLRPDNDFSNYPTNRKRIKELFWLANPDRQLYSDESDDVYVLKQTDKTEVIAYLHCGIRPFLVSSFVLEFIRDLKKLCADKEWPNCQIIFITDFNLRYIFHTEIEKLPRDIKYFILEPPSILTNESQKLKLQNLSFEISESKSRFRRSKIMPHSDYDPNSEAAIMRAIKNGYGDLYGLG